MIDTMVQDSTEDWTGRRTWVDDPIGELMQGMLKNARDTIDDYKENCHRDIIAIKHETRYFVPMVDLIGWLAESDGYRPDGITFNDCCNYLQADPELVREKFQKLIQEIPYEGHRKLRKYIAGILSDCGKWRQYLKSSRGPDQAHVRGDSLEPSECEQL